MELKSPTKRIQMLLCNFILSCRNDLGHILLSHLCTGFDLKSIWHKQPQTPSSEPWTNCHLCTLWPLHPSLTGRGLHTWVKWYPSDSWNGPESLLSSSIWRLCTGCGDRGKGSRCPEWRGKEDSSDSRAASLQPWGPSLPGLAPGFIMPPTRGYHDVSKVTLTWEGSLGEKGYMYMYGWVPLLCTWNYHNVVKWLYSNIKEKI